MLPPANLANYEGTRVEAVILGCFATSSESLPDCVPHPLIKYIHIVSVRQEVHSERDVAKATIVSSNINHVTFTNYNILRQPSPLSYTHCPCNPPFRPSHYDVVVTQSKSDTYRTRFYRFLGCSKLD